MHLRAETEYSSGLLRAARKRHGENSEQNFAAKSSTRLWDTTLEKNLPVPWMSVGL